MPNHSPAKPPSLEELKILGAQAFAETWEAVHEAYEILNAASQHQMAFHHRESKTSQDEPKSPSSNF